jgi:hypothetical protein
LIDHVLGFEATRTLNDSSKKHAMIEMAKNSLVIFLRQRIRRRGRIREFPASAAAAAWLSATALRFVDPDDLEGYLLQGKLFTDAANEIVRFSIWFVHCA